MIRIVMKQEQLAHICVEPEGNHAPERAMAPTDVLRVLLVGILRIQDRQVAALNKLDHLCALGCGKIACFVLADSIARGQLQLEWLVRLIVGKVGDGSRACKKTVTRANARMICKLGTDLDFPDLKLHLLQLLNRQMTREFA